MAEDRPQLAEFRRRYRRSAAIAPPDVVHVHGFRLDTIPAAAMVARDGCPVLYTEHATLTEHDGRFAAIRDWSWTLLGSVDAVTCVSSRTGEVVAAVAPAGMPVGPAHHAVPAPPAGAGHPRRRSPGSALHVVCLARLMPEKGVDVLVDALGLVAERGVSVRATLAGHGDQHRELVDRVRRLGLAGKVQLLGGYEPGELAAILGAADVVVSTSHTEGLPLSLVEAFAHGVPVIATSVGGVPELVMHEDNGLLVPPADAAATADAVVRLSGDEDLRMLLARGARATFDAGGYSPAAVAAVTLDAYSQARSRAAAGSSSSRANRVTASSPLSQVYRASYSRVAASTRRWRSARFR
jgi:glycosyltransferase involved in cell wall biosynthesis